VDNSTRPLGRNHGAVLRLDLAAVGGVACQTVGNLAKGRLDDALIFGDDLGFANFRQPQLGLELAAHEQRLGDLRREAPHPLIAIEQLAQDRAGVSQRGGQRQPWKESGAGRADKVIEEKMSRAVHLAFGLPAILPDERTKAIKLADHTSTFL